MKKLLFPMIIVLVLVFLSAGCGEKCCEKTMPKWEYKVESVPDTSFATTMNKLGAEGWEVVFARRARNSLDEFSYEMIFKRPVIEKKEEKK